MYIVQNVSYTCITIIQVLTAIHIQYEYLDIAYFEFIGGSCSSTSWFLREERISQQSLVYTDISVPKVSCQLITIAGKQATRLPTMSQRQKSNLHPFATKNSIIRNLMSKFLTSVRHGKSQICTQNVWIKYLCCLGFGVWYTHLLKIYSLNSLWCYF